MFKLPELSYSYDALEPIIDKATMEIHYTKHHQGYVTGLNTALENHLELLNTSVEDLLKNFATLPESVKTPVRNHGGGHANHTMFWKLLKKDSGTNISGQLLEMIQKYFGSVEKFKEEFETAAKSRFGSGWAWLVVAKDKTLKVISTPNQDSPIMDGLHPVLGLDVWEHSYYLKYQNRRPDYIAAFWSVIDWDVVQKNLAYAL
ncbi:MAG: superoxide dismutase [Brevinema sp.]